MRVIKSIVLLFLATLVIVSCSKDDDDEVFKGGVYVTLVNKGTSEIQEGEATKINYEVVLTKSFDKDIKLVFNLENLAQFPNLVSPLTEVIIPKNKTKGAFSIIGVKKSDAENILKENIKFNLILKSSSGIKNKIELDKEYSITVKKEEGFEVLTNAQKELIKGYKSKGIDLTKWIGKIPVSVKVITGEGGNFAPFENSEVQNYSGVTYITLSDNATVDKPLLKMVNNAFGLNEYLQWVFRGETIENLGFWYNPSNKGTNPAGKKVLKALGDDKVQKWINKEYDFNVFVDNIEVKSDRTIEFIRKKEAWNSLTKFLIPDNDRDVTNKLSIVNFQYEFPLWDELVKLVKNNNELTEHIEQGGSIHPNNYIGSSPALTQLIDVDEIWKNWVKPEGKYSDKEMTFKFNSDHISSGSYDIIEVTLTVK